MLRLPLYLTRFFGRDAEQRELVRLIETHRLVSLTGPGGVGKTRLAAETVRQSVLTGVLPAVFVPLAPLSHSDRVGEAALHALGVAPQAGTDPAAHVAAVLRSRETALLILDNAEHVLDAVAALALFLLAELPALRLLITSRQRLQLPGEACLPLAPLETPPDHAGGNSLAAFPAAALFLDRARLARPDFAVPAARAGTLVQICQRLDGMPLGIELAAARVSSQSLGQIADALAESLTRLESRQRGLSPRHQSLRAAIDGSLELLTPDLRDFFTRLSVFRGGWTARAAGAVIGRDDADGLLEDLQVRSLIVSRDSAGEGEIRYSLLETLRQFADERLSDEDRAGCRARHASYYLALAAEVDDDDPRTGHALDDEGENLLAAFACGRDSGGAAYWRGGIGALRHAYVRGHQRRAAAWADDVLLHVAAQPDARLRFQVRYAAGGVLVDLARWDDGERLIEQMQADCRETGDPVAAALLDAHRGFVAENRGDIAGASALLQDALRRARVLGDPALLMTALSLMSSARISEGTILGAATPEGRESLGQAIELARELLGLVAPHSRRVPLSRLLLFMALSARGDNDDAYRMLKETQTAALHAGTGTILMYTLIHEARLAVARGFPDHAALLYGAFSVLQERMGYSVRCIQSYEPDWTERIEQSIREALGPDRFESLARQGRHTAFETLANTRLPGASLDCRDDEIKEATAG